MAVEAAAEACAGAEEMDEGRHDGRSRSATSLAGAARARRLYARRGRQRMRARHAAHAASYALSQGAPTPPPHPASSIPHPSSAASALGLGDGDAARVPTALTPNLLSRVAFADGFSPPVLDALVAPFGDRCDGSRSLAFIIGFDARWCWC